MDIVPGFNPESGQVVAAAYHPSGEPVRMPGIWTPAGGRPKPGGKIYVAEGRDERRAISSVKRCWWHPKRGKPGCSDLEGADLVGATIRIGGEIVERYDRLPVFRVLGDLRDLVRCVVAFDGAISKISTLQDGVWGAFRPMHAHDPAMSPDTSAAVAVHFDWVDARAEAVAAREAAEVAALNAAIAAKKLKGKDA